MLVCIFFNVLQLSLFALQLQAMRVMSLLLQANARWASTELRQACLPRHAAVLVLAVGMGTRLD